MSFVYIYIPYLNYLVALMAAIIISGFIRKLLKVNRDRKRGIRRLFFPLVEKIEFAVLYWILSFIILWGLVHFGMGKVRPDLISKNLEIIVTTMLWLFLARLTYKPFFVSVPAFVGLVTESFLGGEYFVYSAGIHIKYPWESAKLENYFSLEIITVPFFEDFVASDGGVVLVKGSFSYRPELSNLISYAQIEESVIVIGFTNIAKRMLTVEIAKRTSKNARLETHIIKEVMESLHIEKDGQEKLMSAEEKRYGVQFLDFTLADVGYDAETQNVLTTDFAVNNVLKFGELEEQEIQDRLVYAGKVKKDIKMIDIRGLESFGSGAAAGATKIASLIDGYLNKGKKGAEGEEEK